MELDQALDVDHGALTIKRGWQCLLRRQARQQDAVSAPTPTIIPEHGASMTVAGWYLIRPYCSRRDQQAAAHQLRDLESQIINVISRGRHRERGCISWDDHGSSNPAKACSCLFVSHSLS